jgi:hypothetical protein
MLAAFVGLLPFLLYERLALGVIPLSFALGARSAWRRSSPRGTRRSCSPSSGPPPSW